MCSKYCQNSNAGIVFLFIINYKLVYWSNLKIKTNNKTFPTHPHACTSQLLPAWKHSEQQNRC